MLKEINHSGPPHQPRRVCQPFCKTVSFFAKQMYGSDTASGMEQPVQVLPGSRVVLEGRPGGELFIHRRIPRPGLDFEANGAIADCSHSVPDTRREVYSDPPIAQVRGRVRGRRIRPEQVAFCHAATIVETENRHVTFQHHECFTLGRVDVTMRSHVARFQKRVQETMRIVERAAMKIVIRSAPDGSARPIEGLAYKSRVD